MAPLAWGLSDGPRRIRPAWPMTAVRAALLWGLVAEEAARRGGQVAAADVCAVVVEALPVSGAWVMAQGTRRRVTLCA